MTDERREHAAKFAGALGMDPDMAYEIFFRWQEDYTVENLPALREKYRHELELLDEQGLSESDLEEALDHMRRSVGYKMWQALELLAVAKRA